MTRVSLLKCPEYDNARLRRALNQGLEDIGFDVSAFRGARVALKPNLLMPFAPESAVVTHPEFFRAAVQMVKEHGGIPVIIESPNFFELKKTMRRTGFMEIAGQEGVEIPDVTITRRLAYPQGRIYKGIEISEAFFSVDVIVNLPKFKTHAFTHISGAVKNLFGTIPGLRKSRMHARLPDQRGFCTFLLDLAGAITQGFDPPKKVLHLMDAILAMEGEGPGPSGAPKQMGCVLAGTDPVAVDWVAASVAGVNMDKALTIGMGFERPFAVSSPEEIEVVGDSISSCALSDFVASKHKIYGGICWPMTSPTVKNWFVERPVPQPDKCVLCYQCQKTCPASAISQAPPGAKVPRYDYRKCIRCFCCMEICPEAAISATPGWLQGVLNLK